MKSRKICWPTTLFLAGYQIALIIALPFYLYHSPPSWGMVAVMLVLWYLTGLSITVGYHRYYAHRSHQPGKVFEFFLLLFGTLATQGSALRWSFNHRKHHQHTDTDHDPHSIKEGFWHAHMGWLFYEFEEEIDEKRVSDLIQNKWVMFQHNYYTRLMLLSNALVFLAAGYLLNDFLGAFMLALWGRMFLLHHFTWFINSLAHTWGSRTYARELSAVDNYMIALLTFGEGYHNYHHAFPSDYRNGVRWYHYDPSKWMIWTFEKLGWTRNTRTVNRYVTKGKIIREDKKLFLNIIKESTSAKSQQLAQKVHQLSEQITNNINEIQAVLAKRKSASKESRRDYRRQLKQLREQLRNDWNSWVMLSRQVVSLS